MRAADIERCAVRDGMRHIIGQRRCLPISMLAASVLNPALLRLRNALSAGSMRSSPQAPPAPARATPDVCGGARLAHLHKTQHMLLCESRWQRQPGKMRRNVCSSSTARLRPGSPPLLPLSTVAVIAVAGCAESHDMPWPASPGSACCRSGICQLCSYGTVRAHLRPRVRFVLQCSCMY